MNRDEIEGLIKVLSGPDLYSAPHIRAIAPVSAAALRELLEEVERLRTARLSMINSLILIAREARSSGNRTFDQCIDALTHIDDFCRAQLTGDDQ